MAQNGVDRPAGRLERLRRLAFTRQGWRAISIRISQAIPLPRNEPNPIVGVKSLDDLVGIDLREQPAAGLVAPRRAPRTVGRPHPQLECAGARQRDTRGLRVASLPGWRVESVFGFVLSPSGYVLEESAWGQEQIVSSRLLSARRLPRPQALEGEYASLISQWCQHYYHWLADALPRFLVLEKLGFGDAPILVPRDLSDYQRDSLLLLGADAQQLISAPADLLASEVLVWPAFAGPSGHPPVWACRELADRLRHAAGAGGEGRRRLLISRRLASHRRVLNEEELVEALSLYDFEVVTPETLSLIEQVRLFAEAELVVAPHGAGLANMLFATNATAIEIHEPDNINTCFYNLIDAAGNDYWYVLGERFDGHAVGPSYRDIRAPVAAVVSTVATILDASS